MLTGQGSGKTDAFSPIRAVQATCAQAKELWHTAMMGLRIIGSAVTAATRTHGPRKAAACSPVRILGLYAVSIVVREQSMSAHLR